jgi:hypothetical protein
MKQIKKHELNQIAALDVQLKAIKTVCRMKGRAGKKRYYIITFIPDISVPKRHEEVVLLSEDNFQGIMETIKKYLNDSPRVYQKSQFVDFVL